MSKRKTINKEDFAKLMNIVYDGLDEICFRLEKYVKENKLCVPNWFEAYYSNLDVEDDLESNWAVVRILLHMDW